MPAKLTIDRLTLKLSGLSKSEGERLAQAVATRLAEASVDARLTGQIDSISVDVSGQLAADSDILARHIVAEVIRRASYSN